MEGVLGQEWGCVVETGIKCASIDWEHHGPRLMAIRLALVATWQDDHLRCMMDAVWKPAQEYLRKNNIEFWGISKQLNHTISFLWTHTTQNKQQIMLMMHEQMNFDSKKIVQTVSSCGAIPQA